MNFLTSIVNGGYIKKVLSSVVWNIIGMISRVTLIFCLVHYLSYSLGENSVQLSNVIMLSLAVSALLVSMVSRIESVKGASSVSREIKKTMRSNVFRSLHSSSVRKKMRIPISEQAQLAIEGVDQLEGVYCRFVLYLVLALVSPSMTCALLLYLHAPTAIAFFSTVCLIVGSLLLVLNATRMKNRSFWSEYLSLGDAFLENLTGLVTLKLYQVDKRKQDEMDSLSATFRKATMKLLSVQLHSITGIDIIMGIGMLVGTGFAITSFFHSDLSLSVVIFIIMLVPEVFSPVRQMAAQFHVAMTGIIAGERLLNMVTMQDSDSTIPAKTEVADFEMVLENISFSYDGHTKVLDDVSLYIPQNSLTGISGASGSGKSTLAALICGRMSCDEGYFTIGGCDSKTLPESHIASIITYVGSDPVLFSGTIAYNLLMAKGDATNRELEDALHQVGLLDELRGRGGLDYCIRENADNLSGGQKQRLAVARALLLDSPVYIFDEATSNIDTVSEEIIRTLIYDMKKDKTVVFITHRLANMEQADMIYHLNQGKIREYGTHHALIEANQQYAMLYRKQCELELVRQEVVYV